MFFSLLVEIISGIAPLEKYSRIKECNRDGSIGGKFGKGFRFSYLIKNIDYILDGAKGIGWIIGYGIMALFFNTGMFYSLRNYSSRDLHFGFSGTFDLSDLVIWLLLSLQKKNWNWKTRCKCLYDLVVIKKAYLISSVLVSWGLNFPIYFSVSLFDYYLFRFEDKIS